MSEVTCQKLPNMYTMSRLKAKKSRFDAAWELHISDRTLARYELAESIPPPDIVDNMAKVYSHPGLTAIYCSDVCPIGQKYAHQIEERDLATAVLGFLRECRDLGSIKDKLVDIAEDGQITTEERVPFEEILNELMDVEQKIEIIKLWAARVLPLDEIIRHRKEKTASRAAI